MRLLELFCYAYAYLTSVRDMEDSCGMLCIAKHAAHHTESAMSLLELFCHVDAFCEGFLPHWISSCARTDNGFAVARVSSL